MSKTIQKKYYFSTEGETEEWYLRHLEGLINKDEKRVVFIIKKARPKSYVKRISTLDKTTVYHFFDVESNNSDDVIKFKNILTEMTVAEKLGKEIKFFPCYSNLTFELWIILHKADCNTSLHFKNQYLEKINKTFGKKYESLAEYKEEKHFKEILRTISLEDVTNAIQRAEKIMRENNCRGYKENNLYHYKWYSENPSTEVGSVIGKILKDCSLM